MWLDSIFKRSALPNHDPVSVVVVGAGRMGSHHARILSRLPNAKLLGVIDSQLTKAKELAVRHQTNAYAQLSDLPQKPQAAVIAVPTSLHLEIARPYLTAQIDCLIEKPIAPTLEDGKTLINLAKSSNTLLQIGHIERFNPAIMSAIPYMDKPLFVEINRLGPYDPRIQDVGVVLDLMIHDLDMVSFLIDSPVKSMEAFGARVLSKQEDIAKVRLRFDNGCLADLSASRVSLETYRRIRIFQASSYMSIDYAKPDIKVYRKKGETLKSLLDVDRIHPTLRKEDALTLELSHFLYSVSTRQTPLVTGEQGLRAVSLAQDVLACLQIHE